MEKQMEKEQSFEPKGAIAFMVIMFLIYFAIWFSIWLVMVLR